MKNKSARRRNRCNKPVACKEHDRLTKLPNDVLLNILERLDIRDAVRTCTLSKKMVNLPRMLSRFRVDVRSFAPRDYQDGYGDMDLRDVIRTNGALAAATNKILSSRCQLITLSRLSIRFYLRYEDCVSIGETVARAMAAQKIDIAEFTIITEKEDCEYDYILEFTKQFNSFFAACPDAFAGLTHLWLQNLRFGESEIPNILNTCKRLESLHFDHCDSGADSVFDVQHPQLAELEVYDGDFEIVKLTCVPKLKRVACVGWNCLNDPLSFGYVPLLSSVSLGSESMRFQKPITLSQFLGNVTSISDLHLDFQSEQIWVIPERPKLLRPVLEKLQTLNLVDIPEGFDITWTMFMLEAAPSLKELCITVWDHWCLAETDQVRRVGEGYREKQNVEWESSTSDFTHANLAKLSIYGFQPDDNFMRYTRNMMTAAVNLKEISLYDRKVCPNCADLDPEIKVKVSPSRYPRTGKERDLLRRQITKGLEVALPDVIHFRS